MLQHTQYKLSAARNRNEKAKIPSRQKGSQSIERENLENMKNEYPVKIKEEIS